MGAIIVFFLGEGHQDPSELLQDGGWCFAVWWWRRLDTFGFGIIFAASELKNRSICLGTRMQNRLHYGNFLPIISGMFGAVPVIEV